MKFYLFRKIDSGFYYKEYLLVNEENYMNYKMASDQIKLINFDEEESLDSIKEKIYSLLNKEFKKRIWKKCDEYYKEKYIKINLKTIAETFLQSELIDKKLKDKITLEWLL